MSNVYVVKVGSTEAAKIAVQKAKTDTIAAKDLALGAQNTASAAATAAAAAQGLAEVSATAAAASAEQATTELSIVVKKGNLCLDVRDYGATLNGVDDDTQAFLDASADLNNPSVNARLYIPEGVPKITAEIPITCGATIYGDGRDATYLLLSNPTQNGFVVNTSESVHFEKINIDSPSVTKTAGAGILFTAPATQQNANSTLDGVSITRQYSGIHFLTAVSWCLNGCYIVNSRFAGALVENTLNADNGDGAIVNCTFDSVQPGTTYGIYQKSAGGVKVANTKIFRHTFGYKMNLDNAAATSILLISNCSIEMQTGKGIELDATGPAGEFLMVVISGNEFSTAPIGIATAGTFDWLKNVNIANNTFTLPSGGTGIALNRGIGVNLTGNNFTGTGGASVGITLAATAQNVDVGPNTFQNVATKIYNVSASSNVYTTQQSGAVSCTTSGGYGSLFSGTASITFPKPYASAPALKLCVVGGGAGGVSAGYDSVSTTGATIRAFGITSGGVVTVQWVAEGVLA